MQRFGNNFRSILAALTIAAVLAISGNLEQAQNTLNELRMGQWQRDASGQIVFIGIDKKSIDAVGTWPWPRSIHAQAIDKLSKYGASEVAFDVDFSTPSKETEDTILAKSMRDSHASIVLPTFLQPGSIGAERNILVQSQPISILADEAWIASVNVIPDADGLVRNYARASTIEGELVPSLSSVLSGAQRLDSSSFPVDFSINPASIPTYSLSDLLAGSVPQSAVNGKSVLVGAHALELRDNLNVPVHGIVSGPVLQILAAETLIQKRVSRSTSLILILGVMAIFALMSLVLLPKIRLALQMVSILATALAVEAVCHYAFKVYAVEITSAPILAFLMLVAIIRTAGDLDVRTWLLRLAKAEAANTRVVLDQVFEDSSDAIVIVREDGTILEKNSRFSKLFAAPMEENDSTGSPGVMLGKIFNDARTAIQRLDQGGDAETALRGNLTLGEDEQQTFIEYSVTPSRVSRPAKDADGEMEVFSIASITARDVTVEVNQRRKLEYLSRFDALTGCERRNQFVHALTLQGAQHAQTKIFALSLLRFNDLISTMGRELGDQLLISLHEKIKTFDQRIEGVVMLDRCSYGIRLKAPVDPQFAAELPRLLLAELADPIVIDRQPVSIDFCVGHAQGAIDSEEATRSLVNHAEFALREAEAFGPNGICAYNARTDASQRRARQLEQEMRGALSAGEFHVDYQPQVLASNGKPIGAEALVRWTHPEFGAVSPTEFVEIAETTGLIIRIGQFVLNQACRDAMAWDAEISVSVNVSPIQLYRSDVVQDVRNALKTSGLPAERLIIELTESSFIGDEDGLFNKLEALKRMGVSIVLDDFGTGYSSLGYLARFPMDKIKVDQSFVRDIAKSPTNQAIVRSIKVLADGFNIKVLCEGVETESDLSVVRQLGCQEIQGYYFGRPQSTFEIIRFLSNPSKPVEAQAPKLEVVH